MHVSGVHGVHFIMEHIKASALEFDHKSFLFTPSISSNGRTHFMKKHILIFRDIIESFRMIKSRGLQVVVGYLY